MPKRPSSEKEPVNSPDNTSPLQRPAGLIPDTTPGVQELQTALAEVAETLITTQRNLVSISRSLSAVRISLRELHPDFEKLYAGHFAEPDQAFDAMRDSLLDRGRELANMAGRLRKKSQ
jgi:hypothetical protein